MSADRVGNKRNAALNVLHVVESWRPAVSGYTSRGWALIEAQASAGVSRPSLLVSSRQHVHGHDYADAPAGMAGRVEVLYPSTQEKMRRRWQRFYTDRRYLTAAIVTACAREKIDVIHCHWPSAIGTAAAEAARKTGTALVAEVRFDLAGAVMTETVGRGWPPMESRLRFWFERYLKQAQGIAFASHSLAAFMRDQLQRIPDNYDVIPNGIDRDRFRPAPADHALIQSLGLAGRLVVGSTTNMLRYEGLDLLIQTAARYRGQLPDLHLLFVGDGTQAEALRALAAEHDVPATFTGSVSPADVSRYLRLFDVFAVPRRDASVTRYASPIKVMEAMASGLPVIATKVGGNPDLVRDGATGSLIPPGDPAILAACMVDYLLDPERRRREGRAARARAETEFSIDTMVREYDRLYRSLLDA